MPEKDDGGKGFSKTDMERVGIFKELGYVTIGDNYKVTKGSFNESASKGRQIMSTAPKKKSGLQAGYFNDKFSRVMEGEAYSDQVKLKAEYRMSESKKNIAGRFVPTSTDKKMPGAGSYYGSFSGPVDAFSPVVKPGDAYKAPNKNLYTNPGKKGTGYGYVGVTFSKYNDYASDDYNQARTIAKKETEEHKKSMKGGAFKLNSAPREYFDENPYKTDKPLPPEKPKSAPSANRPTAFKPTSPGKRDGGMKAGTFDPYPSHSSNQYGVSSAKKSDSSTKSNKVFIPPAGIKSTPVNSVLHQNISRSVNVQNYRTVQTVMAY